MTSDEKYTYWYKSARYDLDTADAMVEGGRWFYVVFMCQQAIEKLCKGLYNFYIDDSVPRVHNIRFILSKIETVLSIKVDTVVYNFFDTLSAYYLNDRYPDFTGKANTEINKDKAMSILRKTKEVFTWLETLKK